MLIHAGRVTLKAPLRWTSMTGSSRSGVMLWNVLSRRMPALLMTMSTLPKASMAVLTIASPPSGVATLLVSATATPPRSSISLAVVWAGPASPPSPEIEPPRSLMTTCAPRDASSRACSRPSPPPAPVMIATLLSNPRSAIGGASYPTRPSDFLSDSGDGLVFQSLVVDLAVGGPAHGVDRQHPLGRLVGGQPGLDVADQLGLVEGRAWVGLDHGRGRLAPLLVGRADHNRVPHSDMGLEDLLDLLGVHLLAAGVDAHRTPAEDAQGAVGVDGRVVTGDRIALAVDHEEGAGRLLLVLVVAEGHPASALEGDAPDLLGSRHDIAPVLGDDPRRLAEGELGRRRRAAGRRDGRAHAQRLRRRERVGEDHPRVVLEQALLGLLAPHHARRRDRHQARQVPLPGVRIERPQNGLGERVAHDGDGVDLLALHGVEELVGLERAPLEGHDRTAGVEHAERGER